MTSSAHQQNDFRPSAQVRRDSLKRDSHLILSKLVLVRHETFILLSPPFVKHKPKLYLGKGSKHRKHLGSFLTGFVFQELNLSLVSKEIWASPCYFVYFYLLFFSSNFWHNKNCALKNSDCQIRRLAR